MVSGIETKLNGWSWIGLVVVRLSVGVSVGLSERRRQEHDVDLQCMQVLDLLGEGASQPQQAYRNFFYLPPLGGFGWLMAEAWDSKGFIPLFREVRYGLDSLLSWTMWNVQSW